MFKISLLLLLALAMTSTDYHQGKVHIYYIDFNKRYTVDITRYKEGYLPGGHSYFFGLAVEPDDEMSVDCRVQRNAQINFKVDVCPFTHEPSTEELVAGNMACVSYLKCTKTSGSDFDQYSYPFSTSSNINHIAVHLLNYQSLYYLDVYIYSLKGMSIYLWILIILLPCIICVVVILLLCKMFGCLRIRVTSGQITSGTGGKNYI